MGKIFLKNKVRTFQMCQKDCCIVTGEEIALAILELNGQVRKLLQPFTLLCFSRYSLKYIYIYIFKRQVETAVDTIRVKNIKEYLKYNKEYNKEVAQ